MTRSQKLWAPRAPILHREALSMYGRYLNLLYISIRWYIFSMLRERECYMTLTFFGCFRARHGTLFSLNTMCVPYSLFLHFLNSFSKFGTSPLVSSVTSLISREAPHASVPNSSLYSELCESESLKCGDKRSKTTADFLATFFEACAGLASTSAMARASEASSLAFNRFSHEHKSRK